MDGSLVDDRPPAICRVPSPSPPGGQWFTEITAEVGLGTIDQPLASANSIYAADLDGDGFPDLLASMVAATRETAGKRTHWLLMNRPSPIDPSRRVFVDTTLESGLEVTRDGVGGRGWTIALEGDLDNDGDVDLITCPGDSSVPDTCIALLNDGHAHFSPAPKSELEPDVNFASVSGALLDFDRDGNLDFWPGTGTAAEVDPYWLFQGRGDGTFHDVAAAAGLPTQNGDPATFDDFRRVFGVTACDLNGDGAPDVLLAAYGREANQLFLNDGRGHFTEHARELGIAFDDRMDFTDDQSYRCWCQANAGKCPKSIPAPLDGLCPDRGWTPGVDDQPWRLGGNNFGIACGDIDNDGDMDLLTATIVHWDVGSDADPSELLRNDTPGGMPLQKFTRPGNSATGLARKHKSGWNDGDMMPLFADFDLDGRKDIYLTSSDYPDDRGWLWRQKSDGTFEDLSAATATTQVVEQSEIHGIAVVDLDGDGDLDVVAGTSTARGVSKNAALRVYRNDIGQASNWTQIVLHGLGAGHANASAVGARVKVTAGGVTQVEEVAAGAAHEAMNHGFVLTFGLGAACAIDAIEVRWPDAAATVQTFPDVRANYRVQITEGAGKPSYRR